MVGRTTTDVSGGCMGFPLLLSAVLGSDLEVLRFPSALSAVPPLSKNLEEVESFLWLVPAHSITMETSCGASYLHGDPTNLS